MSAHSASQKAVSVFPFFSNLNRTCGFPLTAEIFPPSLSAKSRKSFRVQLVCKNLKEKGNEMVWVSFQGGELGRFSGAMASEVSLLKGAE